MARIRLTLNELSAGVLSGDKAILGRAITLVESQKDEDRILASELIREILPFTGKSFRLGITGSPGVGKSTFIDGFGEFLIKSGKKLAILAVDPTSKISGGSILGDKTRMEKLVNQSNAFIRPSPAGDELGGVAQKTFESILLCEAAGYDMIFVETVGVGQSETSVKEMTDFLLFLTIAGAGDELQGIKRGIMEMIDMVVINKADLVEAESLAKLKGNLIYALHLFPEKTSQCSVNVFACSSLKGDGFEDIWKSILNYEEKVKSNSFFDNNRNQQKVNWMNRSLQYKVLNFFYQNAEFLPKIKKYEELVIQNSMSPIDAANQLFELMKFK
ncbi:methylmalonyl Co-A mutase-associated GTPase MeaB [Lacihabitans sp. LS3-19]|uniref:methylmalonyl Co-A mutase-associated GTPase MeaB n=1 Tax=Lacihabitans sp. LS3-19 TaxID=2487335 RepID=UPI0020CE0986|nr:methylmalonyl Co-A mutase-associated GTPase MeaB [Lacihabitans sp. LS3-19]MCP9771014.1 methylmalonyl Co-A mutase-associated GTPase MeaB [Lacihabitans sp. LS3-19]